MKNNPRLLLAILLSFALISTSLAAPIMQSADDEVYERHETSTMIKNILITDDATTPVIVEGEIRITIPETFEAIFDTSLLSEIVTFGDATDSGKISDSPEVSFEDGDKTIVIPILGDFDASESFTLKGVYMQGFHTDVDDEYLTMTVGSETIQDTKYISIDTTFTPPLEDDNEPDMPTDLSFEMTEEGMLITWEDPTDLDLNAIQILRGVDGFPVDGRAYDAIGGGTGSYLDTDLSEGQEVSYILRATDGINYSDITEQYDMVFEAPIEEEVIEEEIEEEVIEEETVEEEELIEEEETTEEIEEETVELITIDFDDADGHWGEEAIEELAGQSIVEGDPEGTFRPDDSMNRAEAATLIARVWDSLYLLEDAVEYDESAFSDVAEEDWYYHHVMRMEGRGVIDGNPDGSFAPAENINRAEFLQLAFNLYVALYGEFEAEATSDAFEDIASSDWFYKAVATAANEGWVEGSDCEGEVCFFPANEITRAEGAQILYNMFYALITE